MYLSLSEPYSEADSCPVPDSDFATVAVLPAATVSVFSPDPAADRVSVAEPGSVPGSWFESESESESDLESVSESESVSVSVSESESVSGSESDPGSVSESDPGSGSGQTELN